MILKPGTLTEDDFYFNVNPVIAWTLIAPHLVLRFFWAHRDPFIWKPGCVTINVVGTPLFYAPGFSWEDWKSSKKLWLNIPKKLKKNDPSWLNYANVIATWARSKDISKQIAQLTKTYGPKTT